MQRFQNKKIQKINCKTYVFVCIFFFLWLIYEILFLLNLYNLSFLIIKLKNIPGPSLYTRVLFTTDKE